MEEKVVFLSGHSTAHVCIPAYYFTLLVLEALGVIHSTRHDVCLYCSVCGLFGEKANANEQR